MTTDRVETAIAFARSDAHEGDLGTLFHEAKSVCRTLLAENKRLREDNAAMVKQLNDQDLRMEKQHREWSKKLERLRELLMECRRYIDASPAPSDLWAIGLCRELDEVLKGGEAAEKAKESEVKGDRLDESE